MIPIGLQSGMTWALLQRKPSTPWRGRACPAHRANFRRRSSKGKLRCTDLRQHGSAEDLADPTNGQADAAVKTAMTEIGTSGWTWVLMRFRLEQQIYLSEKGDTNEVALAKHFASRSEAEKFASRLKHTKWKARLGKRRQRDGAGGRCRERSFRTA